MLGGLRKLLGLGGAQAQPQQQQAPQWQNRIPVGQALTDQDIQRLPQQVQSNARIYNANPQDARVASLDPAQFGYQADEATPSQSQGFQGDPAVLGYKPDITYNPTNKFVPFSTKNLPIGSNPQLTNTGGLSSQTPNFGDVLKRLRF